MPWKSLFLVEFQYWSLIEISIETVQAVQGWFYVRFRSFKWHKCSTLLFDLPFLNHVLRSCQSEFDFFHECSLFVKWLICYTRMLKCFACIRVWKSKSRAIKTVSIRGHLFLIYLFSFYSSLLHIIASFQLDEAEREEDESWSFSEGKYNPFNVSWLKTKPEMLLTKPFLREKIDSWLLRRFA